MSWWVSLSEEGRELVVDNFQGGGTQILGGSTIPSLNITYNYAQFYYEHLDKEEGLRWLNGKKASETTYRLARAVNSLGVKQDKDYWKATPSNAGYALSVLFRWSQQYPNAVWRVN